jgi:hypothetical protein
VALDALLMADGLVNDNAFFASWGLMDYVHLLGTMGGAGQTQTEAQCYQDFATDYLFLSGIA